MGEVTEFLLSIMNTIMNKLATVNIYLQINWAPSLDSEFSSTGSVCIFEADQVGAPQVVEGKCAG